MRKRKNKSRDVSAAVSVHMQAAMGNELDQAYLEVRLSALEMREEDCTRREEVLQKRQQSLQVLNRMVAERYTVLVERETALAEKEQQVALQLKESGQERENLRRELTRMAGADQQIEALKKTVAELENQVAVLQEAKQNLLLRLLQQSEGKR